MTHNDNRIFSKVVISTKRTRVSASLYHRRHMTFSHSPMGLFTPSSITCCAHHHHVLWSLQHEQETANGTLSTASQLSIQSLHFTLPLLLQLTRNDLIIRKKMHWLYYIKAGHTLCIHYTYVSKVSVSNVPMVASPLV